MRRVLLVAVALLGAATTAVRAAPPVSRLAGGPRDCLTTLELIGTEVSPKAKSVVCHDGSLACDRDGLVNGRCEFWTRLCANDGGTCGSVDRLTVDVDERDADLVMLARTLEGMTWSAAGETCAPATRLTVALGKRANGSARQARKRIAWRAQKPGDKGEENDTVSFVCKPPVKEKRRGGISFASIQKRVFEKNCTFSGCHGTDDPQAGLVLTGDRVYESLVDKVASTSTAQFAGKKLVVPGAPETSFLLDKLEGTLGPGDGVPMPKDRKALSAETIETIANGSSPARRASASSPAASSASSTRSRASRSRRCRPAGSRRT